MARPRGVPVTGPPAWREVDAVVFDLDGTLYETTPAWFGVYAEEVAGRARIDAAALEREVRAVLAGERPLRLGDFYDPDADLVVRTRAWQPDTAVTWYGTPAPLPSAVRRDEPLPWTTGLVYVGDAFQAFAAAAAHAGAGPAARAEAFVAVRRQMIADERTFAPAATAAALERAFGHAELRALATNTPEDLGRGLVDRLDASSFFTEVRFGVGKPAGLVGLLDEIAQRVAAPPERILCVGDSYWNDVLPALAAGCQAVWVDPHASGAHDGVPRVGSLRELQRDVTEG